MRHFTLRHLGAGIVAVVMFTLVGCGQPASDAPSPQTAETAVDGQRPDGEPMHGGWWCYEHGIPEEQCAMCDTALARELREKGDWCDEHNRPDSLCFTCHPEYAQKFIDLYEAKRGEKPPKPNS